jgi:hypothetical protein
VNPIEVLPSPNIIYLSVYPEYCKALFISFASVANNYAKQTTTELKFEGCHNFAHSLGIGLNIKFMANMAIDVSGSYYSNYTNFLKFKAEVSLITCSRSL